MKAVLFAVVAIVSTGRASSALAWHAQGHLMTAEVAWQNMDAGARCRAAKILRAGKIYGLSPKEPGVPRASEKLFVTAATWPDRIKQQPQIYHSDGEEPTGPGAGQNIGAADKLMHKYWHYVDFPVPDDPSKPPPSINALERIQLFRDTLASTDTTLKLKAYDLAWLIHLTGDVHQPLHTATQYAAAFNPKDNGGNSVRLKWSAASGQPIPPRRPPNLHSYWDGAPGDDRDDLVAAVAAARALTPPPAAKVAITDPVAWVQESHAYADAAVYVAPVVRGQAGPMELDAAYQAKAEQIAREQVALGGYRLAGLLNTALVWPDKTCDKATPAD